MKKKKLKTKYSKTKVYSKLLNNIIIKNFKKYQNNLFFKESNGLFYVKKKRKEKLNNLV